MLRVPLPKGRRCRLLGLAGLGLASFCSFPALAQQPAGVSGASAWYRADANLTLSGSTVTAWNNSVSGGAAGNLTPSNSPQIVPNGQNYNPAVLFNNSQLFTSAATALPANSNYTKFVVFKYDGSAANNLVSGNPTSGTAFWGANTTNSVQLWHNGTVPSGPQGSVTTGSYYLATGVYSAGTANGTFININGTMGGTAIGWTAAYDAHAVVLGGHGASGNNLIGRIAEAVVYPSALTAADLQKVESYLGLKYGLSIGHNYLSSAGTTIFTPTGFSAAIAGIGRDDLGGAANGGLLQKQSSSNPASEVVMALGSLAATNSANTGTFSANQQFLIWGSNGGTAANTSAVTGISGVGYVSAMRLRVENTGGITQSVQVLIPAASIASFTNPRLVTSPDTTYGNGNDASTAMSPVTVNGVSYYACTTVFPAGASYFTVGGLAAGPGGIAGCTAWVRADSAVTATGSNISAWTNIAGASNNFTATGNPQYLAAGPYNFNPAVSFTGTNYFTSAAPVYSSNSNYTKFVVFRYGTTAALNNLLSSGGTGTSALYSGNTTTGLILYHNGDLISAAGSVNPSGAYFLGTGVYSAGTANGSFLNVNGALKQAITTSTGHTTDVLQIGAFQGQSLLNGSISEAVVYNNALSAADIQKVESYLGLKYGLPLGHNYLSSDGTVVYDQSTYGTDVAGIGRDAAMQLYQKQATTTYSNATNQTWTSGTIVTMSMGTPAATNALNTSSFSSDKNFLVWGNDNASTTATPLTGVSGLSSRMTRTWKVTHTGSVGSVTLLIPVAGVSLTGVNLLTNGSASFSSGSTATPMTTTTFNGVSFYRATVTFPAGTSYFSFAGNQAAPGGIAGSNVWVKADAGVSASGSTVSAWTNQSNSANSLAAAGTGSPTLNSADINYNPSVLFAGNSALNSASDVLTTNSNYTKFVIFKYDGATPNNILGAKLATGTNGGATLWGGTTATDLYLHHQDGASTAANIVSAVGAVSASRYYLATGVYSAGTTSGSFLSVDGTQGTPVTVNASYLNHPLSIGGFNGGNYLTGRVAEAIVFPSALSTASIQRVESYLAIKYGMTLSHDYLASDGSTVYAVGGYGSNIASIGRDDAAQLYQRQSQSSRTTGQVVMSLGTLQGSNAGNAGIFASDKQFLSWGDNGTAGYVSQTGVSGVNLRTGRIWKVQNVNNVSQSVQVLIPAATLSGALNPVLIWDNASTFGSSSNVVALTSSTINGTLYYTATLTWPAGVSYMTYGGTGTFPGGVQGASMWVRANSGVATSGSNATAWTDYASGNNLAASGSPVLSSADVNYNPSLVFNGSAYFTSSSNVLEANSNYSKFVVFKYDGAASNNLVSSGSPSGTSTAFWGDGTVNSLKLWHNGTNQLATPGTLTTDRYYLGTGIFNSGAVNGTFINVDGSQKVANTISTGFAAHTLQIGGHGGSNNLLGRVAEAIIFPSQLNASAISQVESYLGLKYGITLGHNYVAADGSTTVYDVSSYGSNVAGIGRDDLASQNQKQSTSLNTDANAAMVSMGLGSIAAANSANSAAFGTDRSYLVWGDNNAAVAEVASGLPGSQLQYNKRLGRSWKVQRTGTPGATQVKVNLGSISTTGVASNDFALLIDRDGDGNFATGAYVAYQPSSYSGGVLTFDNVQWDSDASGSDVFTVVTQVTAVNLNLTVYLQGAMPTSGTTMRNNIQAGTGGFTAPSLPTSDPYSLGGSYAQINDTTGPAGKVTDWVRVEVRSATAPATVLQSRALLLKPGGSIVEVDGSLPRFNPQSGAVRIVVLHRNHLNVMSNSLAAFNGGMVSYNFSTALTQAYKYKNTDVKPMAQVNGVWCLWAGDTNMDGYIDNADDRNVHNAPVSSGSYSANDVTLDGNVNSTDKTLTNTNFGYGLYSPTVQY